MAGKSPSRSRRIQTWFIHSHGYDGYGALIDTDCLRICTLTCIVPLLETTGSLQDNPATATSDL
jgi:hypothetical protein